MSLPFNAEIKPCNPENGAHTTTGQRAWAQTMSLDKLRRHSRVFEKKILKAPLKEALVPFKAEEQEEISEESSKNPIDAQLATFCPIKSLPISSMPGRTVPDLSEQGHLATGINQTAFSTTCPDTSCISSLKSIVVIKKILKAPLKEALIPFKAEEQEEISEESSKNPIDAQLATFCPIKSLPISSMPSPTVPDLSEQGHLATGINQTAFSTTCPDTSCISSLKSIVVIFGFLSNLEAHIENSGNVIIVRWVARTKKSYFFIKKKIERFGKNLEQRLNKKIAAGARYKRQTQKH